MGLAPRKTGGITVKLLFPLPGPVPQEEATQVQKLISEGMSPAIARAEVLGVKEAPY